MTLPIDITSDDYNYRKTLHEDVKLKPVNSKSKFWDIQLENGDYVNVTGKESLYNAICIAVMTRFRELDFISLYDSFGCKIHELVKANKSQMVRFKVESYTREVLENMRRIQEIKYIEVTEPEECNYGINFSVASIDDEIISGSLFI